MQYSNKFPECDTTFHSQIHSVILLLILHLPCNCIQISNRFVLHKIHKGNIQSKRKNLRTWFLNKKKNYYFPTCLDLQGIVSTVYMLWGVIFLYLIGTLLHTTCQRHVASCISKPSPMTMKEPNASTVLHTIYLKTNRLQTWRTFWRDVSYTVWWTHY